MNFSLDIKYLFQYISIWARWRKREIAPRSSGFWLQACCGVTYVASDLINLKWNAGSSPALAQTFERENMQLTKLELREKYYGMKNQDLCDELGITMATLLKYVKANDIPLKGQGFQKFRTNKITVVD